MAACLIGLCFVLSLLARLAGNGFGSKWGVSWLPEALHSLVYGVAGATLVYDLFPEMAWLSWAWGVLGTGVSYAGMQAATWMFLRWVYNPTPNTSRTAKIKPVVDAIAKLFGWRLGDEGYSWVAAGVKGFIIGLPVGGILTAVMWPLGYELGSHTKNHMYSELFSGFLGGVSVALPLWIVL